MATGGKEPLSARVDQELVNGVEAYQEQIGADDRSDAHREILRIGLREAQGPVAHDIRDMALDAAYHLALVAVVVLIAGHMTTVLTPAHATAIAVVTLSVAAAPVAIVEMVRAARGQSEIGEALRGDD